MSNLNFSEVAQELHMTPQGARKRILKYQHEKELIPFLIYEKEQLVGLEQEGIEVLRQLGARRRSFTKDRKLIDLEHKIELLEQENKSLNELYQQQQRFSEDYKEQNEKLKAEINEFANGGIIKRLTYKRKA